MSEASPRFFSTEFKVSVVARLERGEPTAGVAGRSGVARKLVYDWLKAYRAQGPAGLNRKQWAEGRVAGAACGAPRIAELERIIGRQQADLHFFREALRLWDATSRSGGAPTSTRSSKT